MSEHARVRVAGLVEDAGRVLIVEHRVGGERWWCFPGGTLEAGETPEEAVARELREEVGLEVEVGVLAAIGWHGDAVELFFRCRSVGATLTLREPTVVAAEFVERARLADRGVFPVEVAADLAAGDLHAIRSYGRFA